MFLSRILTAAAIVLVPVVTVSGPKVDPDCHMRFGHPDSCSPLVACLGGTGIYFTGRAIGWDTGTFAGDTNGGFSCVGQWQARTALGVGRAAFNCDNGRHGIAFFTSQDNATGTASGFGALDDGSPLRVWSGHNIRQFLINKTGDVDTRLKCGDMDIPVS